MISMRTFSRIPSFAAVVMWVFFAGRALSAESAAEITEQNGQWEMAYGDVYYRVFGYVRNQSKAPLKYVKLEMELLDKDGKVVLHHEGYNQKAESLGSVEGYESGRSAEETLKKIEPIAPGEKDLFRIGVGKDEIPKKPKFVAYRLKIVETKASAGGQ
jgi:hypothetical protein